MFVSTRTISSLALAASVFTTSVAGIWVKYCEHANFGGTCITITPKVGECHNVPSNMNDKLSSYQVRDGYCDFFKHGGCVEKLWEAKNREDREVRTSGHKDEVSSIRCTYACCDPDRYTACNLACNSSCKPSIGNPVVDQGCILRCTQGCCPEGVLCTGH